MNAVPGRPYAIHSAVRLPRLVRDCCCRSGATRASHLAIGVLLALVHDAEGLLWFSAIILGAHAVGGVLQRRRVRRGIDGVTGATLIGFGVKLGLSSK